MSEKDNVYIGWRTHFIKETFDSYWRNPFSVQKFGWDGCIKKYEEMIRNNKEMMSRLSELEGKSLGCWCWPENCHVNVLLKLLKEMNKWIHHRHYYYLKYIDSYMKYIDNNISMLFDYEYIFYIVYLIISV